MTVPIRNGGPTLGGVDEDKLIAYSRRRPAAPRLPRGIRRL